jgi:acetoin utilization protein AcuB
MTPQPYTVNPDASVDEALGLMREHGVRHLPVLDKGKVVGLVTDNDLRSAWVPSLLSDLTVADLMNTTPVLVQADKTVYEAARLMHNHKLTGLMVVEAGRLVGIITLADMLKVFVELLGLLQDSVRLDLALKPESGSLEEVHGIIQAHGGKVISVSLLSSEASRRIYSFRLDRLDPAAIIKAVKAAGHEVLD